MAPHVPCTRGRVAPARHGRERPQLAVAAWELNLSLTSPDALRDGPRAAPSRAPIPVVLAQRMRRRAYKLEPACEATQKAAACPPARPALSAVSHPAARGRP